MKLFYCAAAAVLSFTVPAAATLYNCKITKNDPSGWIPQVVRIDVNKNGAVTVFDPIINHYRGKPIKGRQGIDNAKRTTFKWTIDGASNKGQFPTMKYSGTYLKASKKFIVTGKPLGYLNDYRGTGTCKIS